MHASGRSRREVRAEAAPAPLHLDTPLLESRALSRAAGTRVWLKMDPLQPTGSFKLRGVGLACRRHAERGCRRFVSSSGGNAGLAVAYAGRKLGVPVTVVVPESTSERARQLIRDEDAEVLVVGTSWQEAHEHAETLIDDETAYLHPFDHPWLWEGHASLVHEVHARGLAPDAVVLSVGGGGLLSGVARGLEATGLAEARLVTAETEGADAFARSLRAGRRVVLERITSVARSLGAKQVCTEAMEVARRFALSPHVVSDREAVDACLRFADDHRVIVEPACGAALALVYAGVESLRSAREVLVVVCGGAGITHAELRAL